MKSVGVREGGGTLTNGIVITKLRLTSSHPLKHVQILEKETRTYVDTLG